MTALHAAVDSLSQPEVGSMLQVFYNLNELSGAVEKIIALKAKKAVQVWGGCSALQAKRQSACVIASCRRSPPPFARYIDIR